MSRKSRERRQQTINRPLTHDEWLARYFALLDQRIMLGIELTRSRNKLIARLRENPENTHHAAEMAQRRPVGGAL